MDKGNSRQIFEFILSPTLEQKVQSYVDVFIRFNQCIIPQPDNIFFIYFAAQRLENNLVSVNEQMIMFLSEHSINKSSYSKFFDGAIKFLKHINLTKINLIKHQNVSYKTTDTFSKLLPAPYTEETFLVPSQIKSLIEEYLSTPNEDVIDYKEIIELILVNNSEVYSLDKETQDYYKKLFTKLLAINNLNMLNNIANVKTLFILTDQIFTKNIEQLKQSLIEEDCPNIHTYISIYTEILDIIPKL